MDRIKRFVSIQEMKRKPIIVGNWKMNVNKELVKQIITFLKEANLTPTIETVVGVPSIYMEYVNNELPNYISIAAQNCYKESKGAFTGEISTVMLAEVGVKYVILGHVERRNLFREDNELIAEKIKHALNEGFHVIACVDDHIDENSSCNKEKGGVLFEQLSSIIAAVTNWQRMVIAYDSIQATRTNVPIEASNVQSTHFEIRKFLREKVSDKVATETRIIYGGCVNPNNCGSFARQNDIDGFLVGSAALKTDFVDIIRSLNCRIREYSIHKLLGEQITDHVVETLNNL